MDEMVLTSWRLQKLTLEPSSSAAEKWSGVKLTRGVLEVLEWAHRWSW